MIITDKFVFVHMPKTGGTFVTSMLFRIHCAHLGLPRKFFFRNPKKSPRLELEALEKRLSSDMLYANKYGPITHQRPKHGSCRKIPQPHQEKTILSILSSPYQWYVSGYEFGEWRRKKYLPVYQAVPEFREKYPQFPDISFEEFLSLEYATSFKLKKSTQLMAKRPRARVVGNSDNEPLITADWAAEIFKARHHRELGAFTAKFVYLFFKRPEAVSSAIGTDNANPRGETSDMYDVCFIRTANLNQELYDFLLGYATVFL